MKKGTLNRRVRIERNERPAGRGHAGEESWTAVATVWANVEDMLPSRSERLSEGMVMALRPARIRMTFRRGVDAEMRLVLLRRQDGQDIVERTLQIVAGPVELGNRDGIELVAQSYSTAGTGA